MSLRSNSEDKNKVKLGTIKDNVLSEAEISKESGKLKLENLGVEIYKMKTFGDYTALSVISSNLRKCAQLKDFEYYPEDNSQQVFNLKTYDIWYDIWQFDNYYPKETSIFDRSYGVYENFDEIGYFSNDHIQSYIMDNKTGKLYSMTFLKAFDIFEGNVVTRKQRNDAGGYCYDFYRLSINSSVELEVKKIIANDDLLIKDCAIDQYGWAYILNRTTNLYDKNEKVVLYTNPYQYLYDKASKTVFKTKYYDTLREDPYYVMVNGEEVLYDGFDINYLEYLNLPNLRGEITYPSVKNSFYKTNLNLSGPDGQVILDGVYDDVRLYFADTTYNLSWVDSQFPEDAFVSLDENGHIGIYKIDYDFIRHNGTTIISKDDLTVLDDTKAYTKKKYSYMDNYSIKTIDTYSAIGLTKTEYYIIDYNDGKFNLKLIEENKFSNNIIVVAPIN